MSIFEHQDYRSFLRTFLEALPKRGRGSINRMAAHLRVHSSLVSQVLSGPKDFSLEQAQELCGFLGLGPLESDYFLLLVQKERAGTKKLKDYFTTKLEGARKESLQVAKRISQDRVLTDFERSVFYSSWLYSAVRLFTSVGDGKSLEDVAARFGLSRARAAEILRFLEEARLCLRDGGLYRMGPQRTHLEKGSPFFSRHHSNWRGRSLLKGDDVSDEELLFTAPLSISRRDFAKVREEILALIKSTSEKVAKTEAEDVACLNLDLFWVT